MFQSQPRKPKYGGQISPFLGNLSDLQVLDLTLNSFTGIIPPQLGSCSNLTQLMLYENSLAGAIPQTLGGLENLQLIDLGDNLLKGSIPPSLCSCTSLLQLGLINNNHTGLISACIGNLVQLQLFVSFGNKLQGSIPPSIGKLKEIQVLDLSENQLSGKIPTKIRNLSNLEILQLHVNSLSGEIPTELGYCTKLVRLNLYMNQLTGRIPSQLGSLVRLEALRLYKNKLNSTIPKSLYQLQSLIYLELSENQLEGTISLELAYLSSLQILTLHSNNFSGPIPQTITKLSNLTYLSIGFNSFIGSLPYDIGLLYNLKNLTANDNLLSGSIPYSIITKWAGAVVNLTYISLGDNVLSGNVPDDIFYCTQLQVLDLSRNNLNGTLKPYISRLVKLRTLKVWSNSFSGQIPKKIASLSHLIYLEIDGNRFSGPIPPVLSTLTYLEGLALNDNQLQGTIPAELSELKRLIDLRLQNNKLVGPIPEHISKKLGASVSTDGFGSFAYHFTGIIPGSVIAGVKNIHIYLNLSHNSIEGTIPGEVGMLEMVQGIDLSNNNVSGNIPRKIRSCQNLISIDLSGNNLSGSVPALVMFREYDLNRFRGKSRSLWSNIFEEMQKEEQIIRLTPFFKKALILISAPGCVLALIVMLSASNTIRKIIRKRNTRVKNSKIEFPSARTLRRFDAKDIAIATSSFIPENIIGSSALSTVYKGTLEDGQKVAVKKLNLRQFAAESDKCFYREVDIFGRLRHRNLVRVIGYAWESGSLKALVLEFMEHGSLEDIIHNLDRDRPSWTLIKRIDVLVSIASGLVYLHSGYDFPIVHCDLKPSNVLLDNDLEAHVSDFGTTRILGVCLEDGSSVSSSSAFEGTIGYLAPVTLRTMALRDGEFAYMRKVTTEVDVFSFGIIIMELTWPTGLTGDNGFPITLSQLVEQALERGIDGLDQVSDPDLTSCATEKQEVLEGLLHLALSCRSAEPDIRPDKEQVSCSLSKILKMA
ncbi:LRR receptor-like serine/threonine-protein kinase fls2 [Orobanche hederae]